MKITAAELKELLLEETAYAGECGHIVDGIHGLVKGMDPYDAYSLLSLVGDVRISRTFRPISSCKMMLARSVLEQLR